MSNKTNPIEDFDDFEVDFEGVTVAPAEVGVAESAPADDFDDFGLGEQPAPAPKATVQAPVQAPRPQAPVQRAPVQAPRPQVPVEVIDEDSEVPGIQKINFGQKTKRYPFNRYKASKDLKSRVCVLTKNDIISLKVHYDDENRSYLCFDGACCERSGYSRIRYLIPIVVYDTDSSGKVVSQKLEIKILSIGEDKYQELIDINEESPITEYDILITCSDEKYQKMSFQAARNPAKWKTFSTAREVVTLWKADRDQAWKCVAKKVDPRIIEAQLGAEKQEATASAANIPNIDDVIID